MRSLAPPQAQMPTDDITTTCDLQRPLSLSFKQLKGVADQVRKISAFRFLKKRMYCYGLFQRQRLGFIQRKLHTQVIHKAFRQMNTEALPKVSWHENVGETLPMLQVETELWEEESHQAWNSFV